MEITELQLTENLSNGTKLNKSITQLRALLRAIKEKELPTETVGIINQDVEELNATSLKRDDLRKHINQSVKKILSMLKKELKVVSKNHYQHRWQGFGLYFALEMGLIGFIIWLLTDVPFAIVVILLGAGNVTGMAAGLLIGKYKDKKAQREGRQLNFE